MCCKTCTGEGDTVLENVGPSLVKHTVKNRNANLVDGNKIFDDGFLKRWRGFATATVAVATVVFSVVGTGRSNFT